MSPTSTPRFGGVGWGRVLASQFSLRFLNNETPRDTGFGPYSHQD